MKTYTDTTLTIKGPITNQEIMDIVTVIEEKLSLMGFKPAEVQRITVGPPIASEA